MEIFIKLHTIKVGWTIVHKEESLVINQKILNCFLSQKIDFVLAKSAYPDEMLHIGAFHLGLHCLPKLPFIGFWFTKV